MNMRMRLFVALCFLLAGTASLTAQTGSRVGIKAGPVFSSFWGDTDDVKFENHTGLSGGIEVIFPLGAGFAIQPEILYMQKGATATAIENDDHFNVSYDLNYLEIPLLASFTTSEGRLRGRFYIGPFVAALLSDEISGTYAGVPIPEQYLDDIRPEDGFSPVDGGGIIGAGLSLYVASQTALTVDVRLAMSAVPLVLDNNDFVANRALSLSVGLAL